MSPTEKRILDTFQGLLSQRLKVHTLALFGSRARGDADPDSDMDVLVVVEEVDRAVEDYISDCAWEASFAQGFVVVPVVFSQEEWENGPERYSLLAKAIRTEGIVL